VSVTTGTGTEVGITQPVTDTSYTPAGLVEATRLINPDGTPTGDLAQGTGAITRSYDAYSRPVSYTDGAGLATTTSYDTVGRVKTVSNNHGSRTVSYDENGERGSLPTSVAVSDVGTFTARYGSDGTLVRQTLPGGITALTKSDAARRPGRPHLHQDQRRRHHQPVAEIDCHDDRLRPGRLLPAGHRRRSGWGHRPHHPLRLRRPRPAHHRHRHHRHRQHRAAHRAGLHP
jgi:YD repeat-containing protein